MKPALRLTRATLFRPPLGLPESAERARSRSLRCNRITSVPSFTPMMRQLPASARMADAMGASLSLERAALVLPLSEDARSESVDMVFQYPTRAAAPILA